MLTTIVFSVSVPSVSIAFNRAVFLEDVTLIISGFISPLSIFNTNALYFNNLELLFFVFFIFYIFQYIFTLLIKEYILMQCHKRQINQIVSTRMTKCDKLQKKPSTKDDFFRL